MKKNLMVGIGENAGVVDIGEGWAVTFKIESHNHPSLHRAVPGRRDRRRRHRARHHLDGRPPGRRDGRSCASARSTTPTPPASCTASSPASASTATASACPTSAARPGSTRSTRATRWSTRSRSACCATRTSTWPTPRGAGNKVVLFGARTGGDGIGGASILASDTFDDGGPTKRPAVQVGDPFAEKVLIECCLELLRRASWSRASRTWAPPASRCATSELASNGDGGMHVDLENVLLRDPTLTAGEILMSESQERMMASSSPTKLDGFLAVTAQVGRRDQRARRGHRHRPPDHQLARRADRQRRPAHGRGRRPGLRPPVRATRPGWTRCRPTRHPRCPVRPTPTLRATGARRCSASAEPRRQELDHQPVRPLRAGQHRARAIPTTPAWSASTRQPASASRVATDANGRYCQLDPYRGAQLALAEAYRNVATTGATPGRRHRLPQLRQPGEPRGRCGSSRRPSSGLADGCLELEIPVTGGNVSLLQPDRRRARSTRPPSSPCSA